MFRNCTNYISLKITIIYVLIGSFWVLLSDKVLNFMVYDKDMVTIFSLIKGCLYVTVTGVLIYILINNSIKQIKRAELELVKSCNALSEANRNLEISNSQLEASQAELETQYRQALINQNKIKESEEFYRLISEATNDAIWQKINGKTFFSERWFQITGYSKSEIDAHGNGEEFIHPEDRPIVKEKMLLHQMQKTPYYSCEYRFRKKDGNYMWMYARGKASINEKGELYRMAGSYTDITELKEYEQRLHHMAYHDQLTGLKNRYSLIDRINSLIAENNGEKYALLYIDIDNFKYINDDMGHGFGDLLLLKISERLSKMEIYCSTLYRIGGDEFAILVEKFSKKEQLEKIAVNILKNFKPCFEVEKINSYITVSIGISTYPEHGTEVDALLKNADIAVYKAKDSGRNRIVFYNSPMNEELSERMLIEKHLRKALDKNEFELHYQPQLDIKTGMISGFEALIRWNNPDLGFVSPLRFIGVAEATQLIIPIGEWVLKEACKFLNNLERMGFKGLNISVNISMLQLLQEDFAHMVIDSIDEASLNPKQVELEITESILMESYEVIAEKLKLLRAKGVKIALDDFGKGYSSLNYLKNLPITTLKIDKSFIDTISDSNKDKSLTNLIVKIGRSMNLCVVAEGVETQEQMNYLIKHKCNRIQGYLFSKPMQETDTIKRLEEQNILFN